MALTISRLERIASLSALVFLLFACYQVLQPFLFDLVWAAILCFVTWPLYLRLRGGQIKLPPTLASILMILPVRYRTLLPATVFNTT